MLDELVDVIETLKSRINEHRSDLQKDETRTRMALINPLLQVLGWDTSDPSLVTPEYSLSNGRADYALLDDQGKVVVFLEAKRLGEQLARHRSQVDDYARDIGCRYPSLTDGNNWEIYDRAKYDVPSNQSHILKLSIAADDSYKCALQFLLLWRPNMASGQPIEASEPIVGTEPPTPVIAIPDETIAPTGLGAPNPGWITLREVNTEPDKNRPRPSVIRFPGGEEKPITMWRDFLTEVAQWLVRDGALTPAKCPVPDKVYSDVYVVNSNPKHPGDRDFARHSQLSNGLFYTHGTAKIYVDRSIALMEHLGKDPATVHVQVG